MIVTIITNIITIIRLYANIHKTWSMWNREGGKEKMSVSQSTQSEDGVEIFLLQKER